MRESWPVRRNEWQASILPTMSSVRGSSEKCKERACGSWQAREGYGLDLGKWGAIEDS